VTAHVIKHVYLDGHVAAFNWANIEWTGEVDTDRFGFRSILWPEEGQLAAGYMVLKDGDKKRILLINFLLLFFLVGSRQLFLSEIWTAMAVKNAFMVAPLDSGFY